MANVYFGNSIDDTVSVNINNGIQNFVLAPRTTTVADGVVTAINCTAKQIPSGPNKSKDVFGTGGGNSNANKVQIQFTSLEADPQTYSVTTENLSGRDLYIYIFDGSLNGQDSTGRSVGITVEKEKAASS